MRKNTFCICHISSKQQFQINYANTESKLVMDVKMGYPGNCETTVKCTLKR